MGASTADIVVAIRSAVIEQALSPGDRLPEDTIGEQFGVSRTLVRTALSELSAEGLVELRKNRGAVVAQPSWQEARDTFDLRIAVEDIVMRRLSGVLTSEQIDALNAHVDKEASALTASEAKSIRLAGEFHMMLAEYTMSDVLIRQMRELVSRCCLILSAYARPHSSDCGVQEHRQLVRLIAEGNSDEASDFMRQHLMDVTERALITEPQPKNRGIGEVLANYVARDQET